MYPVKTNTESIT